MAAERAKKTTSRAKKKTSKKVSDGIVHIHASFNNTIITVTDMSGNTLTWATAGGAGYRGSRKSTPFAGQEAAKVAAERAKNDFGMKKITVKVNGGGPGREAARAFAQVGFKLVLIMDVTPIAHNGCRRRKRRRV